MIDSIKSLKFNCKVLSFIAVKTNLSEKELKDSFKLLDIKNSSHKELERKIKNLIVYENFALNNLCKSKQKQLGYINKNLLNLKFSSQTLSRINKEIDLELCMKAITERDLFEIDENTLKTTLNRTKGENPKLFLYEIIVISTELEVKSIYDINLICEYTIKNNLTRPFYISMMKDFFQKIYETSKSPILIKKLFEIISEIEEKRSKMINNYNFFINSWSNKKTNKNKVIDYFLEKLNL